jgi:putative sigma-54 modulation protein
MKLEVRFRGLTPTRAQRQHTAQRLRLHLGRFSGALGEVVARVTDVNGPKGGVDLQVQLNAFGPGLRPVTVTELGEGLEATVELASARLSRALRRELERGREHVRHFPR